MLRRARSVVPRKGAFPVVAAAIREPRRRLDDDQRPAALAPLATRDRPRVELGAAGDAPEHHGVTGPTASSS
jgi:hypothetical protein